MNGTGNSTATAKSVADKKLASSNMTSIYSKKPINGPQSSSLASNLSHPQCHPKTKNYAYELSRMEANYQPQLSTSVLVNEYSLHYSHGNTAYHYSNWASHSSWPYLWCNCYPLVNRTVKYSQTTSATSSVLVTMCSDLRRFSLQFLRGCTGSGSWSYSHLRLLSCSR